MEQHGHRLFAILLITAVHMVSSTKCTYSIYYLDVSSNLPRLREVNSIDCKHGCCGTNIKYCCYVPDTEEDGLSHVAIVGIVVGCVVVVMALGIFGVCLFRRVLLNTKHERSRPTTTAMVSAPAPRLGYESQRPTQKVNNNQHSTAVTNHFYDNPQFTHDDNIIPQTSNKSNTGKTYTNQPQTQGSALNNTANTVNENSRKVPNEDFKSVQQRTKDGMEQAQQRWSDREEINASGQKSERNGLQQNNLDVERQNVQSRRTSHDRPENGIGLKKDMTGHVNPAFETNKNPMTSKRRLFGSQQYLASNIPNSGRFDSGLRNQKFKSEMHLAVNEYDNRPGRGFTGSTHQLFTPNPRQQSPHPKTYKSTPNLFAEESPRPQLSLPPESRLDYYRYNMQHVSEIPPISTDKRQTSTPHRSSNASADIPERHTRYEKPSNSEGYRRPPEEYSQTKDKKYFMAAPPTATITLPQNTMRKPKILDSSI